MQDDKRDAERYRWLKKKLEFRLGSYHCESGKLEDAEFTNWFLRSTSVFVKDSPTQPEDLDQAIDKAMEEGK